MKTFQILVAGILASSVIAMAAPTCGPVADVTTLNAGGGCTVGPLLFSNFVLTSASPGHPASPQISIVQAYLGPASDYYIQFAATLLGTDFAAVQDLHFSFQVQKLGGGTGPQIGYLSIDPGPPASSGNSSHVQEVWCDQPINQGTGSCPGTVLLSSSVFVGNPPSKTTALLPAGGIGYVWKDIQADQSTAQLAGSLRLFTEGFGIPEPMTMALSGLGLALIGLLRRKKA